MSSITRVLAELPQLPGTKVKTKVVGNKVFTRATMPNGDLECSIVERTPNGSKLLKSAITTEKGTSVHREGQIDKYFDKKSGRCFDSIA